MTDIEQLLPFIKEIDRLKNIDRQALIHNGGRRENSAEHSWHLALTVILFADYAAQPINIFKAVKMALLHDLVEIDAGDTFVYDESLQKKDKELKAIERITSLLPQKLGADFKNLWQEFEDGVTPEACYVAAIDRFLPIYSNALNQGYSWKNHNISADRVIARNKPPIIKGLPALWTATENMISTAVANGHIKKS